MKDNDSMTTPRQSPVSTSSTSERPRSTLAEQSHKVVEDVRGLGSDVKNLGNAAVTSANEALQDVRKKGTEALEHGREKVTDARGGLEHYVQSNPLKSLLMAAGAGALISLFMRR